MQNKVLSYLRPFLAPLLASLLLALVSIVAVALSGPRALAVATVAQPYQVMPQRDLINAAQLHITASPFAPTLHESSDIPWFYGLVAIGTLIGLWTQLHRISKPRRQRNPSQAAFSDEIFDFSSPGMIRR